MSLVLVPKMDITSVIVSKPCAQMQQPFRRIQQPQYAIAYSQPYYEQPHLHGNNPQGKRSPSTVGSSKEKYHTQTSIKHNKMKNPSFELKYRQAFTKLIAAISELSVKLYKIRGRQSLLLHHSINAAEICSRRLSKKQKGNYKKLMHNRTDSTWNPTVFSTLQTSTRFPDWYAKERKLLVALMQESPKITPKKIITPKKRKRRRK